MYTNKRCYLAQNIIHGGYNIPQKIFFVRCPIFVRFATNSMNIAIQYPINLIGHLLD